MYRILIADDSIYIRTSLKEILTEAGHEVVGEAENGAVAVELYRSLSPDIVTLDITMPELSGIGALKQIVEYDNNANAIMLTAVGKPDMVLQALKSGAKNYITKPLDKRSVLQAINQVMSLD